MPVHRPSRTQIAFLVFLVVAAGTIAFGTWRSTLLPPYEAPAVRRPVPAIEDEVRFLVIGDWGSAKRTQAEVARAMDRAAGGVGGVHAGLMLGDNFYDDGVRSVDDPLFETTFEQVYDTEHLARLRWYAVLGNHDYHGNARAQVEYTGRSEGRWYMPNEYFRVDLPDGDEPLVTLLALDTNRRFPRWDDQRRWLTSQLTSLEGAKQAVIVIGHNPIISYCRQEDRVEPQMTKWIRPIFEKHPVVDLYLSGHAHNMEVIEKDGLRLAIIGTGGKRLHPDGDGEGSLFHASVFGFGLLTARPDLVRLELRDRDNALLFAWEHDG